MIAIKRKKIHKSRVRLFFLLIFFVAITGYLSCSLLSNILNINKMKYEKIALEKQISDLEKTKESLETDILKLNDPEYIAKYVREKYYYSKDGEVILRMDD